MLNCWNLKSGARLVAEEIPYVKSVAIGIYIGVGSRHESPQMAGASHFIEHMLFKGTEKRTAREIADSFEGMGGQLNAFTSKEHTCLYARILDENLYTALDILFDMLFHSSFAPRDFETEKGVIIEEINMYEDTPDDLVHDIFSQQLWSGSRMGSPILGTLDTVSAFARQELFSFYNKAYVPANMVISVAGNINNEKLYETVDSYLEQENTSPQFELHREQTEITGPFLHLLPKETEQVQICLGVPGIDYNDKRRYAQNIMNSILGGGVSSRLFQSVREELGLAYSIYSYPSTYSDSGSYVIYAGTGPARIPQLMEVLHKELTGFAENGISADELSRTRQQLKSSLYLGMESVMNRMTRLGKSLLMYDRIIPLEEVMDNFLRVKEEAVGDLARSLLLPGQFSLAAIGSDEALMSVENEFNKFWR